MTATECLKRILDSFSRKKGNVGVTEDPSGTGLFMLQAGAPTAIKLKNGYVVAIGFDRERLKELRDQCSALLGDS